MNWLGTNTTDISDRASMDFPLQVTNVPCSDYPNVINEQYILYVIAERISMPSHQKTRGKYC